MQTDWYRNKLKEALWINALEARDQLQETPFSVQFVLGMPVLGLDLAMGLHGSPAKQH